jgi:hypothetical protein
MDFAFSPRVQVLQAQVQRFMDDLVLPSNRDWQRYADAGYYPSDVVEPLKAQARAAGLWNLFLPTLRDDEPGTRLSNLDYAPLAEPWAACPGRPRCSTAARPTPATSSCCTALPRPRSAPSGCAAAGRPHPLGLCDERAGRGLVRPHQPADHRAARGATTW